jgi:hypothetical protein
MTGVDIHELAENGDTEYLEAELIESPERIHEGNEV